MTTPDSVSTRNPEAERAVLGAMLLDNTCIPNVLTVLAASDFSAQKYQVTYQSILAVHSRGESADLITVSDRLRSLGTKGDIASFVSGLTDGIPSSANVEAYAKIVRELAGKRKAAALWQDYQEGGLEFTAYVDQVGALRNGKGKKRELSPIGITEVLAYPSVEYVVDPFLPAGALVLVTAFTGVGKSLFASQLSIAAMDGLPFLGKYVVNRQGPILYFDEETPRSYLRDRVSKMDFRAEDPFHLYHFSGVKLDNETDFNLICGQVEKYNPVLIVFDTLIRFHNADENDATQMAVVMGRLRALANLGPCVLVQIHQSKQGEIRVRSRGSSDIIGASDLELALMEKDHGLLELRSVKARMAPIPPVTLKIQVANDRLEIVEAEDWSTEQLDTITEILVDAKEPMSRSAIQKELTARGVEIKSVNTVKARLEKLGIPSVSGPRDSRLYYLQKDSGP